MCGRPAPGRGSGGGADEGRRRTPAEGPAQRGAAWGPRRGAREVRGRDRTPVQGTGKRALRGPVGGQGPRAAGRVPGQEGVPRIKTRPPAHRITSAAPRV